MINTALYEEFIRGHIIGPIGFVLSLMLLLYIEKQFRAKERRNMDWWLKANARILMVSSLLYYITVSGDFFYRYYHTKSSKPSRYFTQALSALTLTNKGLLNIIFCLRAYLIFENTKYKIPKSRFYVLIGIDIVVFVIVQVCEAVLPNSQLRYVMRSLGILAEFLIQLCLFSMLFVRLMMMYNAKAKAGVIGASVRFMLMISLCFFVSVTICIVSFLVDRWYGEADIFFGMLSCLLIFRFPLTDRIYGTLCCCHRSFERLVLHLKERDINTRASMSIKYQSTADVDEEVIPMKENPLSENSVVAGVTDTSSESSEKRLVGDEDCEMRSFNVDMSEADRCEVIHSEDVEGSVSQEMLVLF